MEKHPDREISTALLASMSKFFPIHALATDAGAAALADALIKIETLLPKGQLGTNPFMMAKSQGGIDAETEAEFHLTSQNPVLLNSFGTYLIMYNIPSLPQMPPSTRLLQALWPRLQTYAIRNHSDPLWHICDAGARGGNESAAAGCFGEWHARIPALQAQLNEVRKELWMALPNEDTNGKPFSGSYWCETDYDDLDFSKSHWGEKTYAKLRLIKEKYDPDGLFICHHCVGSEKWTKASNLNCRV
jgi:hypothetical protein